MNTRRSKRLFAIGILALALFPALVRAQEAKPAEHGYIDFGGRGVWGDVYGRPDLLPFVPPLQYSKFEEYRDLRNAPFVRNFQANFEDVFGSKNYFHAQSAKSFFRDQSVLATFGRYDWYKVQIRYDEIPHVFTDTARTLYTESAPGVYAFPAALRGMPGCVGGIASTNLPSCIQTSVVNPVNPLVIPNLIRKSGSVLFSYNPTPDWNLNFSYWREHQNGGRPMELIFNSSPSASLTGGYGAEVPEPIDYFNTLIKIGTEYGQGQWGFQFGFIGSYFSNNIGQVVFDNPFLTTDCANPPGPCSNATQGPATGRMDLYPDNQAKYAYLAGAFDVTRWVRVMASITPGWLTQNDAFLPYTTNTAITPCGAGPNPSGPCTSLSVLPAPSLQASKKTLAMNYVFVSNPLKNVELKAGYRHYNYQNDTPILNFTPVQGDFSAPAVPLAANAIQNTAFGFNRKNFDFTGNWFFAKNSSLKVGYEGEWMDRTDRDVEHSAENALVAAVDYSPIKDLLFRVSYRYANRQPDAYVDDQSLVVSGGITNDQIWSRRFDEAARVRNRGDASVQYSPTQRLSLSAFAGTIQDNYNQQGGTNSPTPLFVVPGATVTPSPYYLYGVLKDLSYTYGFDADYAVTNQVSLFGEYSHEKYHKRIVSRYRAPESTSGTINGCGPNSFAVANRGACDTPNNDWMSTSREFVDIWATGADLYLGKKAYLTAYYSLSAGKGNVNSLPLGDNVAHPNLPLANDPFRFMLVGTNAAVDYPETVSRMHQVTAIFKYKLTKTIFPKVEYRYQQFDNADYQTSAMTQYQGCVSPPPPSAAVPGCPVPILNSGLVPNPIGTPNPAFPNLYPYIIVGDTSAARYLFLGTDQPSYHAHYFAATLEVHF